MTVGFVPFGDVGSVSAEAAHATDRGKVYFVDDMAGGFTFLRQAFLNAGYELCMCSSAAEFADAFSVGRAVGVFADVHLEDGDATDVLDVLRRWSYRAPLFLMSGDPAGMADAQKYAEEIGLAIKGRIAKPFTGRQLVDLIAGESGDLAEVLDRLDVSQAIAREWVYPVLQPKLDLASNKIRSAEVLARMAHPQFGIVAPKEFIGRLKLHQSRQLLMGHLAFFGREFRNSPRGGETFRINVNADVQTLVDAYDDIKALARITPDFYRNLVIEITEEMLGEVNGASIKTLFKYAIDGASFSIDDFGVGESNLSRLARLPVREIKIDRSIVGGCAAARSRGVMVRSVISMAHDLGMRVVAEGVEAMEDLEFLRHAGCDDVQGYLIGRPMRLARFREFAATFNADRAVSDLPR